jgi:hypothetical protein
MTDAQLDKAARLADDNSIANVEFVNAYIDEA